MSFPIAQMLIRRQLKKNDRNNNDDDHQSCIVVGSARARTSTRPLSTLPASSSSTRPARSTRRTIPAVKSLHDNSLEQVQKFETKLRQKQQGAGGLVEEQPRLVAAMGDTDPAINRELQRLDEELELEQSHGDLGRLRREVADISVMRAWCESLVVGWFVSVVIITVLL